MYVYATWRIRQSLGNANKKVTAQITLVLRYKLFLLNRKGNSLEFVSHLRGPKRGMGGPTWVHGPSRSASVVALLVTLLMTYACRDAGGAVIDESVAPWCQAARRVDGVELERGMTCTGPDGAAVRCPRTVEAAAQVHRSIREKLDHGASRLLEQAERARRTEQTFPPPTETATPSTVVKSSQGVGKLEATDRQDEDDDDDLESRLWEALGAGDSGGGVDQPRILCLVYAHRAQFLRPAVSYHSWGRVACDRMLIFSDNSSMPLIPSRDVLKVVPLRGEESYNNMWQKVRAIHRRMSPKAADVGVGGFKSGVGGRDPLLGSPVVSGDPVGSLRRYDFFLVTGDDVYVSARALRRLLSSPSVQQRHSLGAPLLLGYRHMHGQAGFIAGAGYVMNAAAWHLLTEVLHHHCNPAVTSHAEDVYTGTCLEDYFGVDSLDTRDEYGDDRFIIMNADYMVHQGLSPHFCDWCTQYRDRPFAAGAEVVATDAVLIHNVWTSVAMRDLHRRLYDGSFEWTRDVASFIDVHREKDTHRRTY